MWLCNNPNAIPMIEKNIDKVNWFELSSNQNAIPILEKNLDKVSWYALSINRNAIHLLFPYNYEAMKNKMQFFCKELTEYVFHPVRMVRICNYYHIGLEEYVEML
jgi:hypothetical protein